MEMLILVDWVNEGNCLSENDEAIKISKDVPKISGFLIPRKMLAMLGYY